jgi:hypothetical protein
MRRRSRLLPQLPRGRVGEVDEDVGERLLDPGLLDGLLGRVVRVAGRGPAAAERRDVAQEHVDQALAAVALRHRLGLVDLEVGQAGAEARRRGAGDALDDPAAAEVHPVEAGVADDVGERAELDHRLQRAPDVLRLVLGGGGDLDVRGRPRHPDGVAVGVPAGEEDGALGLRADAGGAERRLAPLLRADEQRAVVDERGGRLVRVVGRVGVQPVLPDEVLELLVGELERLAGDGAVGDDAHRLDPLGDEPAERRELAGEVGAAPAALTPRRHWGRPP